MDGNVFLSEPFKRVLDYISDGIQIIDASSRLVYCNRKAAMLDDINIETALGKHILEIYPSLKNETSTLIKVLRTGMPILNVQQSFTTYKGKEVTTVNSTLPVRDEGQIIGAVEVSSNITEVKALSEKVVALQSQMYSKKNLQMQDEAQYTFADIITDDYRMLELKNLATKGAQTDAPILVCGETGTGKELFVQAIHNSSRRHNAPFIAQNCAALPVTLLEGILFGTMKGGFTGAVDRPGLFELADGGTLFLDEINSMPMELQAKLLRVLQQGIFRRIGDTRPRYSNVRIITAVNVKPEDAVFSGQLRQDLFYRLNTITLNLPTLKERQRDLELLIKHFINKYNRKLYKHVRGVSEGALGRMKTYDWPGNVRELEHVVEGAMSVMDSDWIEVSDLPFKIRDIQLGTDQKHYMSVSGRDVDTLEVDIGSSLKEILDKTEKRIVEKILVDNAGNVSQTAKQLKIPRQTLQYKIKKYKLEI